MPLRVVQFAALLFGLLVGAPAARAQSLLGGSSASEVAFTVAETREERLARSLQEKEARYVRQLERLSNEFAQSRQDREVRRGELMASLQSVRNELSALNRALAPLRERLLTRLEASYEEELQVQDRVRAAQSEIIEELSYLVMEASFFRSNTELALSMDWSVREIDALIESLQSRHDSESLRTHELELSRWEHMEVMGRTLDLYRQAATDLAELELDLGQRRHRRRTAQNEARSVAAGANGMAEVLAERMAQAARVQRAALLDVARRQLLSSRSWAALVFPVAGQWRSPIAQLKLLAATGAALSHRRAPPTQEILVTARARVSQACRVAAQKAADADPEGNLDELALRVQRQGLSALVFQRELDRIEFMRIGFDLEELALRLPFLRYSIDLLHERREEIRRRERTSLRRRDKSWLDPEYVATLFEATEELLNDPASALSRPGGEPPAEPITPALAWVIVLAMALGAVPLIRSVRRRRDETAADRSPRRARRAVSWLPLTAGLVAALALDVLPDRLRPAAALVALMPLLLDTLSGMSRGIEAAVRDQLVTPFDSAYLRSVIRVTGLLAFALALVIVTLRALDYSVDAVLPLWGLLVSAVATGTLAFLVRRRSVLTLLRLQGVGEEAGLLRRFLALGYPLLVLLIIFPLVALLIGYMNLASFVFRRGLVVLAIAMFLPVAHERIHRWARARLRFPEGGGSLEIDQQRAQTAYRALAPVITALIGLGVLAALSFAWSPERGKTEFLQALTAPLVVFGDREVSVLSIGGLILTIVFTVMFTRWLLANLRKSFYPLYDLTEGMRASFDMLIRYSLLTLGVLVGLKLIGVPLGTLAIFAGVVGIGIGFGSQTLVGNFIAGLILQFSKSINVGDIVEVEGIVGRIQRISGAATIVRTYDNLSVVVPNALFVSSSVVNWTESGRKRRLSIKIGVAYGSDVGLVRELLIACAGGEEAILEEPAPSVHFDDFGESSLDFTLLVWIADADRMRSVATKIRHKIDVAFRNAGVRIPFPQRDVHLRPTDEETRAAAAEHGWDIIDEPAVDNPEIEEPEDETDDAV